MVVGEPVVDGWRLDEVLVHGQVAVGQGREVGARIAKQKGGQEGETSAHHHGIVEHGHGGQDHLDKGSDSPNHPEARRIISSNKCSTGHFTREWCTINLTRMTCQTVHDQRPHSRFCTTHFGHYNCLMLCERYTLV